MLTKLKDQPFWYKAWAIAVAAVAILLLVRLFSADGLRRGDYALMIFVHVSVVLDFFLFPKKKEEATQADVL